MRSSVVNALKHGEARRRKAHPASIPHSGGVTCACISETNGEKICGVGGGCGERMVAHIQP